MNFEKSRFVSDFANPDYFRFSTNLGRECVMKICMLSLSLRSVNFRMSIGRLHLNQEMNENISVSLPYLSKIGQIKKELNLSY